MRISMSRRESLSLSAWPVLRLGPSRLTPHPYLFKVALTGAQQAAGANYRDRHGRSDLRPGQAIGHVERNLYWTLGPSHDGPFSRTGDGGQQMLHP
jgi:hypothetical protein